VSYNSETNKTKDEGEKREIEEKKQTNKENNRERCAAKSLKEGKKNHWFRNSGISVLVVLVLLL
jgi:hypothetical protein